MNLAALWDFVDAPSGHKAILIGIEGHDTLAVTRILAQRATVIFPEAKIAAASVDEVAWESFQHGTTTPVSPYRTIGGFIGLEEGRSEDDIRVGYDLVFRSGATNNADMNILLSLDGKYSISGRGQRSDVKSLTPVQNSTARMFATPDEEVDELLSSLVLPDSFHSDPIPTIRAIARTKDSTKEEQEIYNRLLAWNWSLLVTGDALEPGLQEDVTSLLREKLTPEQMHVVKTLLEDEDGPADFFSVVALAKGI